MKRLLTSILLIPTAACTLQASPSPEADDQTIAQPIAGNQANQGPVNSNPGRTAYKVEQLVEIAAGEAHTCVRTDIGNLYCWGSDDVNQVNATGLGSPCAKGTCVDRPRRVLGIPAAAQVVAGYNHTCMRTSAGDAYCWGDDSFGQIGQGNGYYTTGANGTTLVAGGYQYTSISAGELSSCGISAGAVYCWGRVTDNLINASGYTGISGSAAAPVYYPGTQTPMTGFASVATGGRHACALSASSPPSLECWGNNAFGQTGNGPPYAAPYPAPSITGASAKADFTCLDLSNGTVSCFGLNDHGQLGNPSLMNVSSYIPQLVGGGLQLHGVSVGEAHACALDPSGHAFCWGWGRSWQLGFGQQVDSRTPVQVGGAMTYKALAAGYYHTCAIGTDNNIYCWGGNGLGQIGTGIQQDAPTPVKASEECLFPDPNKPCP